MNLVTILPPEPTESGLTLTRGTRVLLADGTQLGGVTRIVLTAEVDGIWKAQIDCHFRASELPNVLATIDATAFPEEPEVETTDLSDGCRKFEAVRQPR